MIGITLDNNTSMFCDGMRKHCFTFYQQLLSMNLHPVFICTDNITKWLDQEHKNINYTTYSSLNNIYSLQQFKAIIEWEVFLPKPIPYLCQKYSVKVIRMNCGNLFHSTHERFIKNNTFIYPNATYVSEHWGSPQHLHGRNIIQIIYNKPVITIPFTYQFTKQSFNNCYDSNVPLSIYILEPNISSLKTAFVPIIASTSWMKNNNDKVKHIHIFCSKKIETSILSLLKSINMNDTNKITISSRQPFDSILHSSNKSVIISHQNRNNLNYLYFDAIVKGIPLIHNSDAIKNIGYFYKDNNIHDIHTFLRYIYTSNPTNIRQQLQENYTSLFSKYNPYSTSVIDSMSKILNITADTNNKIPPIYHQTYSDIKDLTPPLLNIVRNNNATFNSSVDWKYNFYNNEQCDTIIKNNFSKDIYSHYQMINPEYGPAKADFFRYCLMYLYGGVYTDLKSQIPIDIYDNLDQNKYDIFLSHWSTRMRGVGEMKGYEPNGEICNWVLISKPKQRFWLDFIHYICNKIDCWDNSIVGKSGVLRLTGPPCLTDFYISYPHKYNIYVHPRTNNKRYSAFEKAKYNIVHNGGPATQNSQIYKNHYTTLTTPIILQPNINTYKTKYGLISLYKNERYIGTTFQQGKYWDEDTLLKLKPYINPNKNIIEIGGHCGTSSIVYSSFISPDNRIFVFEPQKNMFQLLNRNINQNNLQDKIKSFNYAIFCYEGKCKMNDTDLDGGGGNIQKRYNEEKDKPCNFGGVSLGDSGEEVPVVILDSLQFDNIGFIHCDAQGAENFIFSKALETIHKNKPVILYENNFGNYLYKQVVKSYPKYKKESTFDIKQYCIDKLNYKCIDKFNNSIDNLLIPPNHTPF